MPRYPFSPSLSGVLYAEDFGEPLVTAAPPPAPKPPAPEPVAILPVFSLEELRAAVETAHAEGREAERLASAQSDETQRIAALTSIAEHLRLGHEQAGRLVEQGLDAIACTVLSMLSAALPALCVRRADAELRDLLRRVLPPTRHLPELQIRLNPALRQAVEDETSILLEGSGTRVIWTESTKMMPGDVAISWQNGSAVRDIGATCASIRDAVILLLDNQNPSPEPERADVH